MFFDIWIREIEKIDANRKDTYKYSKVHYMVLDRFATEKWFPDHLPAHDFRIYMTGDVLVCRIKGLSIQKSLAARYQ
jgi:hypothetical protein